MDKAKKQWTQRAQPALLALLSSLLLSACASSVSPPARYVLPSNQPSTAPQTPKAELSINAVNLAHYLDVEGIIMQLDDIEMREAREHQWAESLDRQLARNLRDDLATALKEVQVVNGPAGSNDALTLQLNVDAFHGRHDGYAVASGQWQLRNAQNTLLHLDRFQTQTALTDDGYPALVRALDQNWASVARGIATTLTQSGYLPE